MMIMMMIDDETHQKVSPLPGPLSIPFLSIRTFPPGFSPRFRQKAQSLKNSRMKRTFAVDGDPSQVKNSDFSSDEMTRPIPRSY